VGMMNWSEYSTLLDNQITEAKFNLDHAESKYKQCKMVHEALLMQKEMFEKSMDEKINKKGGDINE
jgi:hypothetical protein